MREAGKGRRKKAKQQYGLCWNGDSDGPTGDLEHRLYIIGHHHIGFTLIPYTLLLVVGQGLLAGNFLREKAAFWQAKSSRKWVVVVFAGNIAAS